MSNRRKLRVHTASGLTRPRADWAGHVRGPRRPPPAGSMWAAFNAYVASYAAARPALRFRRAGDR